MNKYDVLISDLAQHLRILNLKLSVNGTCQTVINNQYNVNIEASTTYDSIFLYWQLESSDITFPKDFLRNLLSFSYMGLVTNGAFFSLNKSDDIIFCRRVNAEELTSFLFTKIFDEFIDAIIYCDKEVSRFVTTAKTATPSNPDATTEKLFLRV